jgi:hypothetical protein
MTEYSETRNAAVNDMIARLWELKTTKAGSPSLLLCSGDGAAS